MSFPAPRPVISGKPYRVQTVSGQVPRQLHDFTGDARVLIDLDGEEYTICGPGVEVEDGVHLYEKSDEGAGKDIRVWTVQQTSPEPAFLAVHCGTDAPTAVASDLGNLPA
jgi:hypothetical protein